MRRVAAFAVLVLALVGCGGSTGVRDEGAAPVVQGPENTVRLWFIRPFGRVGVESDLVPVTTEIRAFPNELGRLVLRRLEQGPGNVLDSQGYRTAVGCCDARTTRAGASVTVPNLLARWRSEAGAGGPEAVTWTALAAAAQIQRTLGDLPGVGSVTVQGLSEQMVHARLARAIDTGASAPTRTGSCAQARHLGPGTSITVRARSKVNETIQIRAPQALAVEIGFASAPEQGAEMVVSTVAPCGVFELDFPGPTIRYGRTARSWRYVVRATPLSGPPQPGVTRGFTSFATPHRVTPVAPRVLFVEDDRAIRESTLQMLTRDGFVASGAASGAEGLAAFEREPPDLALLDVMLPDLDGVALCREIRLRSQLPIVFLSARSDPIDIVLGLEAGGDDYVVKPFEPAVLAARLRAALRRSAVEPPSADRPRELRAGSVILDLDGHIATRDGTELPLTPTEFRLLAELALNAGVVLDRSTLLERVWGYSWSGDARLVDVHVQRLRAKVEADPARPETILTVRGVGYKLARVACARP